MIMRIDQNSLNLERFRRSGWLASGGMRQSFGL
jgi:hypothetical protein